MGVSVQQIMIKERIAITVFLILIFVALSRGVTTEAADTPGIDDDTVISVGQAGSIAPSAGLYGWDSRGAVFDYSAQSGKLAGSLGEIMFTDRNGKRKAFLWSEWGGKFPEWWGRMLAERIRSNASDEMIPVIRAAFADYVSFDCRWMISIGIKSNNTRSLYKTLRSDNTLRPFTRMDLEADTPKEILFTGDEMADSLSVILPGERWGSATQLVFKERNPYRYDVRIRSFDVNVWATNCIECARKGLPTGSTKCTHVSAGNFFNIELPILYEGRPYAGAKSFVWEGQTVTIPEPQYEGHIRKPEGDDMSGLKGSINGNSITPTGSSEIFLFYEEVKKETVKQDLIIEYVVLKSSGKAADHKVKTEKISSGITEGEVFSITLPDTVTADGKEYLLIENTETALSYASTPKFANAVRGISSYIIRASASKAGKITYMANEPYLKKRPAVLYVPVVGKADGAPDEPPAEPDDDDHGQNDTPDPSVLGLNREMTDTGAKIEIRSAFFDASKAIPSTENVYIAADFMDYLYKLNATTISGRYPIRVAVDFPYTRTWTENEEEKSESGIQQVTVTVYRDYSYNHLNSFAYYVPESVMIGNPALYPQTVTITAAQAGIPVRHCSAPVVYGSSFASLGGNIDLPENCPDHLSAPEVRIEGDDYPPALPAIDTEAAQSIAESAVGEMRCRNDEVFFSGVNILGDSGWHAYSGKAESNADVLSPQKNSIDSRTVLGEKHIAIPAGVRNAVYGTNIGVLRYIQMTAYGTGIDYNMTVPVNPVSVHTPVICSLVIEECDQTIPNVTYLQDCLQPDISKMHAVIGSSLSYGLYGHENDSCDFYLSISNAGEHPIYLNRLGRGHDYFYNIGGDEGGKYVGMNEVYFPFDVYWDIGNDRNTDNDRLLAGNSWHEIARGKHRFYVPDWVEEGDYCIEARSRAVNSVSRNDLRTATTKNEARYLYANSDPEDYVTADSKMLHVSPKMFGLSLIDISSDAEWSRVFSGENSFLDEGTGTGNSGDVKDGTLKQTLPSGIVQTNRLGEYRFYYTTGIYNELGFKTNRNSKFTLPMVAGCSPDSARQNTGMLKAGYTWTFELFTTGSKMGADGSYIVIEPQFEWLGREDGDVLIRRPAKVYYSETYNGGLKRNVMFGSSEDFENIKYVKDHTGRISEEYSYGRIKITDKANPVKGNKKLQKWVFQYSLPSKILIRVDDKIRKEGYLIISYRITAYDRNGKEVMRYSPVRADDKCSMWVIEGQITEKTDYYGNRFEFGYGDVILLKLGESKGDDYYIDHKY